MAERDNNGYDREDIKAIKLNTNLQLQVIRHSLPTPVDIDTDELELDIFLKQAG